MYNPELDHKNRPTPPCMTGVKILPRKEVPTHKPSDMWTQRDNEIFLRYCILNPKRRLILWQLILQQGPMNF
ncbi:MAG TPA: hypothetical protein VN704_08670 [Verrucomicrobiae bacterium]|nr:hypothetical protein [Verrucomicrobiae bacterium]